jgi:transposase-like protein
VFLRLLKNSEDKHIATFQKISSLFDLKSRQDSNNFYRDFQACDEDFKNYLNRKQILGKAFPIISNQVLHSPILSVNEHYKQFISENPEYKMSFTTFRNYYSNIDSIRLKNSFSRLLTTGKVNVDKNRFLKEIVEDENTSARTRKQIISVFPEVQQDEKVVKREINFLKDFNKYGKNLLVMFLIACGLNYSILSMLMGVSKSTIHNLFYYLTFIRRLIINSIQWWSGEIATDEKWLRLNKKWVYVISIVDNKTGFPLYMQVVTNLKAETWNLFFQRFKKLYGKPKLIVSDGSGSIASAVKNVFPKVNHQLCKFHKLKNLTNKIYVSNCSYKKKLQMINLAHGIFYNKTNFARKRAMLRLIEIGDKSVSTYVKKSILNKRSQLTKGLTSNSAERWNKKIEKVTLGRYGLKSIAFIEQIITALWMKEAITNQEHFQKCFIHELDFRSLCQENIKVCSIIRFFKHKLLGDVA